MHTQNKHQFMYPYFRPRRRSHKHKQTNAYITTQLQTHTRIDNTNTIQDAAYAVGHFRVVREEEVCLLAVEAAVNVQHAGVHVQTKEIYIEQHNTWKKAEGKRVKKMRGLAPFPAFSKVFWKTLVYPSHSSAICAATRISKSPYDSTCKHNHSVGEARQHTQERQNHPTNLPANTITA